VEEFGGMDEMMKGKIEMELDAVAESTNVALLIPLARCSSAFLCKSERVPCNYRYSFFFFMIFIHSQMNSEM